MNLRRNFVLYLALALYVISLALPAIYYSPLNSDVVTMVDRGITVYWEGTLFGIFVGIASGLANIFALVTLFNVLVTKNRNAAISMSVVAVALGLSALYYIGTSIPLDEGGIRHVKILHYGAGYYVWLAALILLFVQSLMLKKTVRS
ncbi:hypothetical protein BH11PAT2_BH11PAT2_09600 [soil metagenome]